MDAARGSISSNSTTQSAKPDDPTHLSNPFVLRHARRYLRDLPYPLPCDLPELHRQNLQTLLATAVFGKALGSTPSYPPRKVLEIACGSGYWSAVCHEYLSSMYSEDQVVADCALFRAPRTTCTVIVQS